MATMQATIKTRTTKALADRLAGLARRNRRSIAEELRIAIEEHLARNQSDARKDGRE